MALLVTGGCGFIGARFVRWQREHYPDDPVVVLDALTYAGARDALDGTGADLVVGDVADRAQVERLFAERRIDAVAHLAAETHVDRSITGPRDFVRTNVDGTANLLELGRAAGVARFLHVSTDEVYGALALDDPAVDEAAPIRPRSPYAASKAAGDHLATAYFHTYGFPTVIARPCNNYGPRQFPEKLIPLMITRALDGEPLPVYGDGRYVRDWLHVDDCCAALDALLRRGRAGEAYNVGASDGRANLDVVRGILRLTGRPESLIRHVTDRPGHDRRYALDAGKLRRELGWAPARRFDEGLAETVDWYRDHASWWRARLGEKR